MDIEKAIKRTWDKLEAEIGVGPISGADRKEIEEWANVPLFEDSEFVKDYLLDLDRMLKVVKIVNQLRKGKIKEDSTMPKTKMGVKAAQIAAQRFQRRVDIAEFVLFRVHTLESLFYPLFMGKDIPKFRIDWTATLKEWNQAHPSDTMTSTHIFRTTFYRILREVEVIQEILRRELAEEKTFLQLVRSAGEAYKNITAQLPPGYPISPKARSLKGMLQKKVKEAHNERTHN